MKASLHDRQRARRARQDEIRAGFQRRIREREDAEKRYADELRWAQEDEARRAWWREYEAERPERERREAERRQFEIERRELQAARQRLVDLLQLWLERRRATGEPELVEPELPAPAQAPKRPRSPLALILLMAAMVGGR